MSKPFLTPIILQMESTECGAAALAIILGYYGKYIPLAEVRTACGVSRDGSRASNMVKAARRYGLTAEGLLMDDWQSLNEVTLPCIVFWKFNHFIVIEKIKKNKVYINDPAIGRLTISTDELNTGFTGVALVFKPDTHFKKEGKPVSIFRMIKERLKNSKEALSYIIIASLLLGIPNILIASFSKIFIDDILIKKIPNWFMLLLVAMLATAIFRGLCTWLQEIRLIRLQTKLLFISTLQFLWHVLHLPIQFFYQRYAGDIADRVDANNRIAELLTGDVSESIVSLITIFIYALVMLLISWPLATIGIIVAIINSYILYALTKYISNVSYRFQQEHGKLSGVEINALQNIETLKASSLENLYFERWAGLHARTINSQLKISVMSTLLQIIPKALSFFLTVIFIGLGSWLIMRGQLTLGSLVAMQSLLSSFTTPLNILLGVGSELPKVRGDVIRLEDVLHQAPDPTFLNTEVPPAKEIKGTLSLRDVSFGYSELDPPLISQFSLTASPKQSIAIVGQSGSGKSTVAKLIAGLYQPWSGTIEYDHTPQEKWSRKQLSKAIALVDQDIFIFNGSIRDNLTLWNDKISEEDISSALKTASIYEDIEKRGGIDASIADHGINFSGGQKQRLEIARAHLHAPTVLILDEATSALDPIVEYEIIRNLQKCSYTLIIITHRLTTIQDCDYIIVMDNGKIAESGKHNDLIQKAGLYRNMYLANSDTA